MADNIVTYKVQVDVQSGKISIDGLTKGFVKAETAVKGLNKEIQNTTTKGLNPMIDKTGLAGATVVELGRTISDSNYGIRGMANNISQLSTLMTTLIVTTGGVANGLKAVWAALMGPLGIIVVFQTVIAVIESFAIKNQGASKTTKELTESINEETEALEALISVTGDVNGLLSQELELRKAQLALKIANKKLVDIEISQADKRVELEEKIVRVKTKLQDLEEKSFELFERGQEADAEWLQTNGDKEVFQQIIKKTTQELNELNEERNRLDKEYIYSLNQLRDAEDQRLANSPRTISLYKEYIKQLKDFQTNTAITSEEFNKAAFAIEFWESKIKEISGSEGGLNKLAAFLEKWKRKRIEAETKTRIELLNIQEQYDIKEAEALGASKEQLIDIIRFYEIKRTELEVSALEERFKALAASTKKQRQKTIKDAEAELKRTNTAFSEFAKKRTQDQYNQEQNDIRVEEKRQERLSKAAAAAQAFGAVLSGLADNINASYQKELDIEENRTTALNNQLRLRLANEQLSANERKNIQDQIAKNDEELRKKQDEIEKKRFKANKAAAIAEATVNTFLAATGVLAQTKGGTFERIAGMIAVIGAGLAQVAMISKQQFVSSQSSIGAGSGVGGGGVQSPDFNIVGASPSNQIAAAVQGQLQKPIKAYVVSKDVSTAQEMDRNIVGTASLG